MFEALSPVMEAYDQNLHLHNDTERLTEFSLSHRPILKIHRIPLSTI